MPNSHQSLRSGSPFIDGVDVLYEQGKEFRQAPEFASLRDATQLKEYAYESLAEDEIRLIELLPSEDYTLPVRIRLHTVKFPLERPSYGLADWSSVDTTGRYEALSYAWGSTYADGSHLTHLVVCNGQRLNITASLHGALRSLRASNWARERQYGTGFRHYFVEDVVGQSGLPLWIDAICINQRNVKEKSLQVARMRAIFQRAHAITVWLGEPKNSVAEEIYAEIFHCHSPTPQRAVVEALLGLPWFHRRWVVQEVSSPGNLYTLRLGDQERSYAEIYHHVRAHGLHDCAGPMRLRKRPLTILQALFVYRLSECSDPLDRIYALRSIAINGFRLRVDYGQSVHDAYINLALMATLDDFAEVNCDWMAIVGAELHNDASIVEPRDARIHEHVAFPNANRGEMLRLLALATCFNSDSRAPVDETMESWVPDWRMQADFKSKQHEQAVELCIAQDCVVDPTLNTTNLPDGLVISKSGYAYMHVEYLTLPMSDGDLDALFAQRVSVLNVLHCGSTSSKNTYAPGDVLWIPWFGPINQTSSDGREVGGVAFVLKPGQTQSSYNSCPVYRLHSCFLLPTTLSAWDIKHLSKQPSRAQAWMQRDETNVEGFYLE